MRHLNRIQFERLYHGSNVGPEVILKEGLKAHNPSEWLNIFEYGEDPDTEDPGHPKGVYLGNRKIAQQYGNHIYSVELPSPHKDWGWTESEGAVWTKDIPPHLVRYEGIE